MSYDTKEGLETFLQDGLAGLRRMAKLRQHAGYVQKEVLHEFVVLGRYYLDTCGNFSSIEEGFAAGAERVLPLEEYRAKYVTKYMSSTTCRLPPVDEVCLRCLRGWDLRNCHDVHWQQSDDGDAPVHKLCQQYYLVDSLTARFTEVLNAAGYRVFTVKSIPNEYCPCDFCGPWFLVNTMEVGNLRMGWRKRVIHIDWESSNVLGAVNGEEIFKDQDTTKDSKLIHAWGYGKATDYLNKLKTFMPVRTGG
jgi:hypothetical protein